MRLQLHQISFSYHASRYVVQGVDLDLASGETVAIVGPSGCGKTTLLRIIAGVLRSNARLGQQLSGTLIYGDSEDLTDLRQRGKIGYMFQTPMLFPYLTVRSNVVFPFRGTARTEANNLSRCDRIIDVVGLKPWSSRFPSDLSGGMKTRVALARTFVTEPRLLLLDEPFGSLDIAWRLSLYNELREMQESISPTTLFVTHDLDEAFLLADRIIVMGLSGRFVTSASPTTRRVHRWDLDSVRLFLKSQQQLISSIQDAINVDVVSNRSANGEQKP